MHFDCPHCGKGLEIAGEFSGHTLSCPECGKPFQAPVQLEVATERPKAASDTVDYRVREPRGSGPWIMLIFVLLLAASYGYAMHYYHESAAQVWKRLTDEVERQLSLTPPVPPAPLPGPKPAPKAEIVPPPPAPIPNPTTPAPTPVVLAPPAPKPPAEPDPLTWIVAHKEHWPQAVTIKEDSVFPILLNGKEAGSGNVPAGTELQIVEIAPPGVTLANQLYGGGSKSVPIDSTDLVERAKVELKKAEAAPAAAGVPAPIAKIEVKTGTSQPVVESPTTFLDNLTFGDEASEKNHDLVSTNSEVTHEGLGDSARRLLVGGPNSWEGGNVTFKMKIDPDKQNYLTVRLWGDDATETRLILFCEGKQVGYRHLGDIPILDAPNTSAPYPGRFFYITTPLPQDMLKGKSEVNLEIGSGGGVFGYATEFEKFQLPMKDSSPGIYRVYTHTDECFAPPAEEKQGMPPEDPPTRSGDDQAELDKLKTRVNDRIASLLDSEKPLNQMQLQFLGNAYNTKWSSAYHEKKVVDQVIKGVDAIREEWVAKPDDVMEDKAKVTYNPGWFGTSLAAEAVVKMAPDLEPSLNATLSDGKTRRAAWSELFQASRDYLLARRKQYTNQSMIVDEALYKSNRAVAAIDQKNAIPEDKAIHYLYEADGIEPWLGPETNGTPTRPLGDNYYQLTEKGLTRELGFVGYYGEVLGYMATMYDASRPAPDQPGDAKLKAQLVKAALARSVFRYPGVDNEGDRAMRAETVVGWRDMDHYPGDVYYGQRSSRNDEGLQSAAASLDPTLVGFAQQMLADNQYFNVVDKNVQADLTRLKIPDEYDAIKAQPERTNRLPMTAGQPDFVFSDEEDGVVAVKHGDNIFYASLYWRANNAVNFLARVHDIMPQYDRLATVHEEIKFKDSGETYERPDDIVALAIPWLPKYPGDDHSAHAGEKLPIAAIPEGVDFHVGHGNPYAGRGDFYTLRYGPYLIAMNMTKDQEQQLEIPAGVGSIQNLSSGEPVPLTGSMTVKPKSTIVLLIGR